MKHHIRKYKNHFSIVPVPESNVRNGIKATHPLLETDTEEDTAYADIVAGQQRYEYPESKDEYHLIDAKIELNIKERDTKLEKDIKEFEL